MALEPLLLLVILVGAGFAFTRRGPAARRARRLLFTGGVLGLTGCVGALSWLDAETSGRGNLMHGVNPYLWTALFVIGVLVMLAGAIGGLLARPTDAPARDDGAVDD